MTKSIFLDTSHLTYYRDSLDNYCHFLLGNLLETFIKLKADNLLESRLSTITTNNPSDLYEDFYQVFLDQRSACPERVRPATTITPKPQTNWKDGNEHLALEHLDEFIAFLKQRFAISKIDADTITYVRRPFAIKARRAIMNEPQIIGALHKLAARSGLNFEAIDLAGTSLDFQVKLMHRTKLLVGLHGAGLVNGISCQRGSHVLEIRPHPKFIHRKFRLLCEMRGVNHNTIDTPTATIPSLRNLKKQVKTNFKPSNRIFRDRFIVTNKLQMMVWVETILAEHQAA